MRTIVVALATALTMSAVAAASEPPYAKLASALGTPHLAQSLGPRDKSQLLLKFTRPGETANAWTKLLTVSIVRLDRNQTERAASGIVDRLRAELTRRHARIATFQMTRRPATAYFDYDAAGEHETGIAYSPAPGFVTVAQVAERKRGAISRNDVALLRAIVGRR